MFDDRYEVILADTKAAREIHHHVRYQVYCLEEGFEDQNQFNSNEERDEWDSHSVHFIVRARQSQEWIAAMRLVVPGPAGLPIEQMCNIDPVAKPDKNSVAEISRLCIVGKHRRRGRSTSPLQNKPGTYPRIVSETTPSAPEERPHKSEIILGLLRAAVDYSHEHNITNWYFLTTPALARIINRLCIQLIKVGSPCNHRGVRHPFIANLKEAEKQATEGSSLIADWRSKSKASYRRFSELHFPSYNAVNNYLVA